MACSRPQWILRQFFRIFLLILLLLLLILFFLVLDPLGLGWRRTPHLQPTKILYPSSYLRPLTQTPERYISTNDSKERKICESESCFSFDISKCGRLKEGRLSIYIYPLERVFVDGKLVQESLSREFYHLLQSLLESPYIVADPAQACLFLPPFDLLNLTPLLAQDSQVSLTQLQRALESLDYWGDDGANHILFSMFPRSHALRTLSSSAILIASSFSTTRVPLHVPFLTFSPYGLTKDSDSPIRRDILCLSAEGGEREELFPEDVLVLSYCRDNSRARCKENIIYPYPAVLAMAEFCIVRDLSQPILWDAMAAGCIPVIIPGSYRLPFDDVIDWTRIGILLYEHQLPEISAILRSVSEKRKERLQSQLKFIFERYFQSIPNLISTALEILREKVFPHSAVSIYQWNHNPNNNDRVSPLVEARISPKNPGFTALILAYERISSLFSLLELLSKVPSLAKILVVWNNEKVPPPVTGWPIVSKPLKVVRTKRNWMSNRFFPYTEIETQAVFALDDDILMLTKDEIEFGFQTWREFPDRLVGFPSRTHVWDNFTGRWKYESEWTNDVSMVLTGAAFYHKYWHYAYFEEMPFAIRRAVDEQMNCEDIAMNFLIANRTGKGPIKVGPRKKFKCPSCSKNEMLSADTSHMRERTDCINDFRRIYGHLPLRPVEFRADPVLFRLDPLPSRLLKFKDIGSL